MYIKVQIAVPYVYAAGSDGRAHAGFSKKNSGPAPEGFLYQRVLGPVTAIVESHNGLTIFIKGVRVTPGGVFAFFFRRGKKEVAAHSISFSAKSRSFCADDPPYPFFSGLACGPPPFFSIRKGGKNRQGALPLNPRAALSIFFLGKSTRTPPSDPAYIKRGCGPRGWGCCIFSAPLPTDPRGPRAPLLYGRRFRRYRTRRFS